MNSRQQSLAEGMLYTDMYELTMAQLFYRMGMHEMKVHFEHFFRKYPDYGSHQAGYCINAGLEWFVDWMRSAHFAEAEIECLRSQKKRSGESMFADDFLKWLARQSPMEGFTVQAVPEGRVVHPDVPLTVIQGPLAMAQIMETSILNRLNFQTLIATKAARVREAGCRRLMIEFGLRRAQDRGGNAATRAALIGGADFSSNTGMSCALGYSPKGTHAHSMIQAFMALGGGELAAFRAYADLYPDDCLLLVDTINTLESGVPNAIKVFEELRKKGHKPVGIRLDSGDLAHLAIQSARLLNDAGFEDAVILLSNQLDEMVVWQIISQIREEAGRYGLDADHLINRLAYGVGTRLVTSRGQGALDGVYKLTAVEKNNEWIPALKVSETPEKTINPGFKHVWRIYNGRNHATADLLGLRDEEPGQMDPLELRHPTDRETWRIIGKSGVGRIEPLLVDIVRDGKFVYETPSIEEIRKKRDYDLDRLDPGVKRLVNPHIYHVSLTSRLWKLKRDLIKKKGNVSTI
ncbi:MAG: nicotinate phosphoribosyltransferase [Desulfobacteraceae bacterium]|nr:nicotinate phosphoribosyltransferase [Desulfobacteraceae bacterium]